MEIGTQGISSVSMVNKPSNILSEQRGCVLRASERDLMQGTQEDTEQIKALFAGKNARLLASDPFLVGHGGEAYKRASGRMYSAKSDFCFTEF